MTERIVALPMDGRPVSVRLPAQTAEAAGVSLSSPPMHLPGTLDAPLCFHETIEWIREQLERPAFALIVSCDALLYGGLVQSRLPGCVSPAEIHEIISLLRGLRRDYPNLKIYAFSTILRDAVTAADEDSFEQWRGQMSGASGDGPPNGPRARNLAANLRLIREAADGTFDHLLIGKEDTADGNPNGGEIEELQKAARDAHGRTTILAGADELACLLVARAASKLRGTVPSFALDAPANTLSIVPSYEPFTLGENLRLQVEAAGGRIAKNDEEADFILTISLKKHQQDLFLDQLQGRKPADSPPPREWLRGLEKRIKSGKAVGLIDAENLNGSSPALVEFLLERQLYFRLAAYAGWNTTANSGGTVAAQCAATFAAGKEQVGSHFNMLFSRLVDDYVFASGARAVLARDVRNPFAFDDPRAARRVLERETRARLASLIDKYLKNRAIPIGPAARHAAIVTGGGVSHASFPWNRLFEALIETDVKASKAG